MTKNNAVAKTLSNHEKRLACLEALLCESKPVKKTSRRVTLAKHLLTMRESRFFSQPRTAEEVHKKLAESYRCDVNRVAVALYRLVSRKQLRKASKTIDKKTYIAYVW